MKLLIVAGFLLVVGSLAAVSLPLAGSLLGLGLMAVGVLYADL